MQELWVQSLSREVFLEKEMASYSSILAWEIPQTRKPGGLQPMGLQRVGHDWATKQQQTHTVVHFSKPAEDSIPRVNHNITMDLWRAWVGSSVLTTVSLWTLIKGKGYACMRTGAIWGIPVLLLSFAVTWSCSKNKIFQKLKKKINPQICVVKVLLEGNHKAR